MQTNCRLPALPATLGAPSCAGLHTYIKTTYTCVPQQVIREEYVDREVTTTKKTTTTTSITSTTTSTTTSRTTTTISTTTTTTTTTTPPSSSPPTIQGDTSTPQQSLSIRDSSHWSVLSNDLNLDILPLEQERKEVSTQEGQEVVGLLVAGITLASVLLVLLLLITARCVRSREARPPPQLPSPSYLRASEYQLPPYHSDTLPLPEPCLFSTASPTYSTVGRSRASVRPLSSSLLPPELRLGWPGLGRIVEEGEQRGVSTVTTVCQGVEAREGRGDKEGRWPYGL